MTEQSAGAAGELQAAQPVACKELNAEAEPAGLSVCQSATNTVSLPECQWRRNLQAAVWEHFGTVTAEVVAQEIDVSQGADAATVVAHGVDNWQGTKAPANPPSESNASMSSAPSRIRRAGKAWPVCSRAAEREWGCARAKDGASHSPHSGTNYMGCSDWHAKGD